MFKSTVRERLIPYNPAEELDLPTSTSGSRRAITPEERVHILKLAETHRSGSYIKLMFYCGLRPGKCIPLQWCDIDLDAGLLHVTKALKKGSKEVGPPKSESPLSHSKKTFPIGLLLLTTFLLFTVVCSGCNKGNNTLPKRQTATVRIRQPRITTILQPLIFPSTSAKPIQTETERMTRQTFWKVPKPT